MNLELLTNIQRIQETLERKEDLRGLDILMLRAILGLYEELQARG